MGVTPDKPGTPREKTAGFAESEQVWIFSAPEIKPQTDLSLPPTLTFAFMRAFAKLTGEPPAGRDFLRLLEFQGWEGLEREDGGRAGWPLRKIDLRAARR